MPKLPMFRKKEVMDKVFEVGDKVTKPNGYPYPGEVRAIFTNRAGDVRLVVESDLAPGMLHIFSPSQIRVIPTHLPGCKRFPDGWLCMPECGVEADEPCTGPRHIRELHVFRGRHERGAK